MQDTDIYTKTEAGREEIRTRALKLSMPMRAILLMVDGQRTVADLRGIIAGSKAPADALDTLLAQELIVGTSAAIPAAPTPMQTAAASAPPTARAAMAPSAHLAANSPQASPSAAPVALPAGAAVESHGELGDPRTRFDRLYTATNEIVRDFLPAHRRYFLQLKIERCNTVEELLEVLHDLRLALAKGRGDAFATDVIARLRSAAV